MPPAACPAARLRIITSLVLLPTIKSLVNNNRSQHKVGQEETRRDEGNISNAICNTIEISRPSNHHRATLLPPPTVLAIPTRVLVKSCSSGFQPLSVCVWRESPSA